jgi:hypothetical protein
MKDRRKETFGEAVDIVGRTRDLRQARASGHLDLRCVLVWGLYGRMRAGCVHDVHLQRDFGVCFRVLHIAAPRPRPPKHRKEDDDGSDLERGFALLSLHGCVLCVYDIVLRAGGREERLLCIHSGLRREAMYLAWWRAVVVDRAAGEFKVGGLG